MSQHLQPSPSTVHWGYLDATLRPVASVRSGESIVLSSVSGFASELPDDPRFHVLDAHREILARVRPEIGPHILTGPVAVEGARAGDVLEARIDSIELIQNWGFNYTRPGRGALPARFGERRLFHIGIDAHSKIATCPWGMHLPLRPFFGIMAVAPAPAYGRVSTIEPREYGGNVDNRELVAGARLFLPVFVDGALFSVGDGHACQGDGEVNLCALETALQGRFTLILHQGGSLGLPRATTPDHFITMAFDPDLNVAAEAALHAMVDALVACLRLDPYEAYALCSMACDLRITQVVDGNKGVHAVFPRSLCPQVSETAFALGQAD